MPTAIVGFEREDGMFQQYATFTDHEDNGFFLDMAGECAHTLSRALGFPIEIRIGDVLPDYIEGL